MQEYLRARLVALIDFAERFYRRRLGRSIPYVGRVIVPCDERGELVDGEEAAYVRFETGAFVIVWLGFYLAFPYGGVEPRTVDPKNPKRYAPGDVFDR